MRALYLAALLAFAADQLSKYLVIFGMDLRAAGPIEVFPPYLSYRYGENPGINFGLFADESTAGKWILIAIAVVICAGVWRWMRAPGMGALARISAGLLIGGALANVLDRLLYGFVLDFLNTSCCGFDNPYVFNVADVFIFAGALGLVFFASDGKPPAAEKHQ
jgi:signal peptidase II